MKIRYVRETDEHPVPREVTLAEWLAAEKLAGFSGPGHFARFPEPATGGFTGNGYRGLIRYGEEDDPA